MVQEPDVNAAHHHENRLTDLNRGRIARSNSAVQEPDVKAAHHHENRMPESGATQSGHRKERLPALGRNVLDGHEDRNEKSCAVGTLTRIEIVKPHQDHTGVVGTRSATQPTTHDSVAAAMCSGLSFIPETSRQDDGSVATQRDLIERVASLQRQDELFQ